MTTQVVEFIEADGTLSTGSIEAVGTILTFDMQGYNSLHVQPSTVPSGASIAVQCANHNNDAGTWNNVNGRSSASTGYAVTANTVGLVYVFPKVGRYMRIYCSAYVSGTVSVVAHQSQTLGITNLQQQVVGTQADNALLVTPYAIATAAWSYVAASGGITDNTAVTIKTAAGSGVKNYLLSLQAQNVHATVDTELLVRDGSAGATLARIYLPAAMKNADTITFQPPIKGTANTLLEIICVTTGTKTYVSAQGYTAA